MCAAIVITAQLLRTINPRGLNTLLPRRTTSPPTQYILLSQLHILLTSLHRTQCSSARPANVPRTYTHQHSHSGHATAVIVTSSGVNVSPSPTRHLNASAPAPGSCVLMYVCSVYFTRVISVSLRRWPQSSIQQSARTNERTNERSAVQQHRRWDGQCQLTSVQMSADALTDTWRPTHRPTDRPTDGPTTDTQKVHEHEQANKIRIVSIELCTMHRSSMHLRAIVRAVCCLLSAVCCPCSVLRAHRGLLSGVGRRASGVGRRLSVVCAVCCLCCLLSALSVVCVVCCLCCLLSVLPAAACCLLCLL